MTQAIAPPLSFLEFLETTPEDGNRYELVNGERVQLMATRAHDDVADFIYDAFRDEVKRDRLNYKISRFASVKTRRDDGLIQGRTPDVSVIDRAVWMSEPKAYAALEDPIQLAVEVSSTNWRDDYLYKLAEYETLDILEYWIGIIWPWGQLATSTLQKHLPSRFTPLRMANIGFSNFEAAIVSFPQLFLS
ncbi:Uma2 family endonuclease [Oscillatoria sp. CS-180]|uniref:Uma2 family endonuclease n=1 Tax=Oscillatoria sp. CS-180 TaxID=3021720 RepID=UPI002FEE3B91